MTNARGKETDSQYDVGIGVGVRTRRIRYGKEFGRYNHDGRMMGGKAWKEGKAGEGARLKDIKKGSKKAAMRDEIKSIESIHTEAPQDTKNRKKRKVTSKKKLIENIPLPICSLCFASSSITQRKLRNRPHRHSSPAP